MASLKQKVIGIILVIAGLLPFLLKINVVAELFNNPVLNYLIPGKIAYQLLIAILGVVLLWRRKPRVVRVA